MRQLREYRIAGDDAIAVHVADLGMACCAVEFGAAVARGLLIPADESAAAPRQHVLVVSGTVTDALASGIAEAWAQVSEATGTPAAVVAFGACTATGGPYWDSYSVTKGIDQIVPVDSYVPGCPPRPEALIDALRHALRHGSATPTPGASPMAAWIDRGA